MSSEVAYATALPRSADPAAPVHVSVLLSPKLTPDATPDPNGPAPTLGEFAVFKDWGALVAAGRLTLTLHDDKGIVPSTVVTPKPDPALWSAAFPHSLPVEANVVPNWSDRDQNTFSVPLVAGIAKTLQWMTAVAAPNDPPLPTAHPLGPDFLKLIANFEGDPRRPRPQHPRGTHMEGHEEPEPPPDPRRFEEAKFREALDRAARAPLDGLANSSALAGADAATQPSPLATLALVALHQARRFYDRPESNTVTTGSPKPRPEPPEHLKAPEPEFHRRIAAAGDHPEFLRKLGLVFDLTGDPARLATARWIAVDVLVDGKPEFTRTLRTGVRALPDGTLIADAATGTTADDVDGAVAFGDPARFQTVDVDPDGSALKMDRFLGNFPRMIALQNNGDDVTAATPALRTQGFVVARIGRSGRAHDAITTQRSLQADLAPVALPKDSPFVYADGIVRGIRVEVWDDHAGRWFSLHERLSTLTVEGYGAVPYGPNEGFLQGTPASETPGVEKSPIYIHESVFGWDGWSLSAPRPGKRLRNEDVRNEKTPTGWEQKELPEDTPAAPLPGETPPDPFRFVHSIKPGSLPRLRFGRSYSFRAWTVDLAGHSRAHELNPQPLPPAAVAAIAGSASLENLLAAQQREAFFPASGLTAASARDLTVAAIAAENARIAAASPASAAVDASALPVAATRVEALVSHLAVRRDIRSDSNPVRRRTSDAASPASLATQSLWSTVQSAETVPELGTAVRDPEAVARVVASHLATLSGPGASPVGADAAQQTVTPLIPFLRWDPVPPPAIVPRTQYTEGESLRTIVIRSGVTYTPGSDIPTVTPPKAYADVLKGLATSPLLALGYREHGERHLVPPKTTHDHAELHSMFDAALDVVGDVEKAKARDAVLAWSRLESGTLFDTNIINVADQWGLRIPQKAELRHDPASERKPLKDIDALTPGEAPASGQYLVIDQDALTLPYLPDPLADGISLRFTDAGAGHTLFLARPSEGFTARYPGGWPTRTPFLLRLATGKILRTEIQGHILSLEVPAGESVKMRLSSSIVRDRIDELGPWRQLAAFGKNPLLEEEAVDGRLWVCSPSEAVVLVHATPRPMERPRWIDDDPRVDRDLGSTEAFLEAGIDLHGPSTESLTAELEWTDTVDDIAYPKPQQQPHVQVGFTSPVAAWEDTAVLGRVDAPAYIPELGLVGFHKARHVFEDTRHHEVAYRLRATTRFREYFPPGALVPDKTSGDDGLSVLSEVRTLHVPSSAPPPPPVIHSVLPLFRWNEGSEPHQPAAWRHTRLSGVRVYLQRPWNASGDGELLAVLLAPLGWQDRELDATGYYSQWGSDPIWPGTTVATRMMVGLTLDHLLHFWNLDDRERPGRPVLDPVTLNLPVAGSRAVSTSAVGPAPASPPVTLLGYRPQFSEERGLWYVDIAFDTTVEFWPFVRLSLARYQPHSLPGAELSAAVRADFVQLVPPRETSVSRTDERHVRVQTSGPVAFRPGDAARGGVPTPDPASAPWMTSGVAPSSIPPFAGRLMVARLQTRDPDIGGDLGWRTVHTQEMVALGISHVPSGFTWIAELAAGEDIVLRTPGDEESAWRVTIEEWERFPGDPPPASTERSPQPPVWEQRLVYADEIHL